MEPPPVYRRRFPMRIPSARIQRTAASAALLLSAYILYGAYRDRGFVAPPYLANPRAGGVSILGFTRVPERWSLAPLTPTSPSGEEPAPTRSHRIDLDNLPPDRVVDVQVLSNGRAIPGGRLRFRTEPGPNVATFDFGVIGDSGDTPSRLREIWGYTPRPFPKYRPEVMVAVLSEFRPRLVLHAGDVAYPDGHRDDYERAFFRPFGPLLATAPIAAAIGNHDLVQEGGLPFLDALGVGPSPPLSGGRYRSFDFGPLHVVVLDSNDEDADLLERQLSWLRADLAAATRPWKVALCHVPLLSDYDEDGSIRNERCVLRSQLLRACDEGGVSVVFAGHNHWYERTSDDSGIVHVVTGGGGGRLRSPASPLSGFVVTDVYHVVHGRIEGETLTLRAVAFDGTVIDSALIPRRRAP